MSSLMQLQDVEAPGRLGPLSGEINRGEILHLVGPNGAGKSTLLARMAGLTQGKGRVMFNDRSLDAWHANTLARHRAFLAQQQMPPFSMPVWHFLSLHQPHHPDAALSESVAAALGLSDKLGRATSQLSGGEWQRVRLAAVIVQIHPQRNPYGQLLLLDEPMNSLDVAQQAALDRLLGTLCEAGVTIVMSSHDLNHTLRHAHRAWLLRKGQLVASGARDRVMTPANLEKAYQIPFRRLNIEGHSVLISAQ